MSGEALGGGVMVAIAAVLWVAYLMPTWARRRQYLATERNAVRLQQTMRILAETAEVPAQVRVEATARTVSAQQKLLAQAESDARADAKYAADAARAARRAAVLAATASLQPAVSASPSTLHRLRRARSLTSLVLLAGVATVAAGVGPALAGTWVLLIAGGVTAGAALGLLSRLAKAGRSIRAANTVATTAPVQRRRGMQMPDFEPVHLEPEAPVAPATWTPRSLPRPMYLSRGSIAQTAMASVDAAAQLKAAAAEAEIALRAAQIAAATEPAATPITRPVARPAASASATPQVRESETVANSRFASMGIIGETTPGMTDLDAVLRRRRAG